MDEIQMVRGLYGPPTTAPVHEVAAARARLERLCRPSRRRLVSGSRLLPLGLGLAAAVTAVTLTVLSAGTGPDPETGQDSGRRLLLAAAEKADHQPQPNGQYWHVRMQVSDLLLFGTQRDPYWIKTRDRLEYWMSRDPGKLGWDLKQHLGAEPASPADAAAWRRAGSPSPFRDARLSGFHATVAPGPGKATLTRSDPNLEILSGESFPLRKVFALPARSDELELAIRNHLGQRADKNGEDSPDDARVFDFGSTLLTRAPLTPQVRAATYRMLAGLHGVRKAGSVRDQAGRSGTAITIGGGTDKNGNRVPLYRLIIDPSTGQALADETVVEKSDTKVPAKPGTAFTSFTVLESHWTNTAPK
ncbi:CU044_5270 family protein [Actinoallomurus sp. NPDC052274]|uniref:CU044_5270 family protein n=1 Tax=Actinoallomurus sp. NPDC052274 TaxID=3155420 RepID=UPI003432B9AB